MSDRKIALVTGGSRGLGRAISVRLAKDHGLHVLVNYASNSAAADETVKMIEEAGGTAEAVGFNVADREETDAALTKWLEANEGEHISVIVNNAGITKDGLYMVMPNEDWDNVLGVSLGGFYNVTRKLVDRMIRKRWGRIVNVVSVSGMMGNAGQVNYSAAKAGVIGATKALAKEIAKRNVTVNAVAPGFVETDMTADFDQKEMSRMIPMGRFGKPEEVAGAVSFLVSDDAAYITGNVININGGLYC
ncbi:MAG: 3-oxoacyl-ACP reductase FabG [Flavobacteriales bacterium]|nr:3-oxoacyl-ACP reductase FabG [Flavobacteriales bacterium]